jgi:hypothetical protein
LKNNDRHDPHIGFCAICGMDIQANPAMPYLPIICPQCSEYSEISILTNAKDKSQTNQGRDKIGASWAGEFIKIVTYINDLGPASRPSHISRWPEVVFETLCESRKISFPATCWIFHSKMAPALRKIIEKIGKSLIIFDR